ncbi:unnamed protein product [Paramecium sonneborni]|uniref:Uncharacterized protein n=1 Tax=Paramecium sonneborni TaxID=65129 RepID=A0A8S1L9A0_9CILI|nr:unnamed protein product [Paramecium sonneborni]
MIKNVKKRIKIKKQIKLQIFLCWSRIQVSKMLTENNQLNISINMNMNIKMLNRSMKSKGKKKQNILRNKSRRKFDKIIQNQLKAKYQIKQELEVKRKMLEFIKKNTININIEMMKGSLSFLRKEYKKFRNRQRD